MFTFLGDGDLERLIAAGGKKGKGADTAAQDGGVKGKLEKVEYMQKDEIMKVHQKNKDDRKARREQVDGPSNMNLLMDNQAATAFEISDEQ